MRVTTKTVLGENHTALNIYIRKEERSHISDLSFLLRKIGKEKQIKHTLHGRIENNMH